ncbi:MAG: lectin-like protein, partial [Phycisphaerales bacterium]|nr:lectin-like protein [Phycisphaerales bacterium]
MNRMNNDEAAGGRPGLTLLAALALVGLGTGSALADAMQWGSEDGGNGHWYEAILHDEQITWPDARDEAESLGGHLATLTSSAENDWVYAEIASDEQYWIYQGGGTLISHGPWIGGFQSCDSCSYQWVTGEAWSYDNWAPSEPFNNPNENFVNFYRRNQHAPADEWNDALCCSTTALVEWSADCNGDGIVDYGQIMDGTLADDDVNGVPDCCDQGEPCGDVAGSDPVQWRVEDGGNGHWYQAVNNVDVLCWAEARDRAFASGGHLATLTDSAENSWIKNGIASDPALWADNWGTATAGPFFGGFSSSLEFSWVTDEDWSFTDWRPGNPNPDSQDSCTILFGLNLGNYGWNNINLDACEVVHSFIVEWSADCNGDGIVDYGQIMDGTLADDDGNGIPDICGRGSLPSSGTVIEGFTIINGYADGGGGDGIGDGGGMLISNASPIIQDCIFDSNEAIDEGGGLYVMDGDPQVTDCIFTNGHAGAKGGGISLVRSDVSLQGCEFTANTSDFNAGGIHLHESDATLDNCFIQGNAADGDGGGILIFESDAFMTWCQIESNVSDTGDGGGALIKSGSSTFVNCHFMNNQVTTGISTTGNGGGVYCDGSSPSFTDCIISGNTAQRWGGGVALFDGASGTFDGCQIDSNTADNGGGFMLVSSDLSMTSCSLEGNAASDDGGGVLFEAGGNGSFTDCQVQGNSAGDSGGGLDCQAANSMLLTGCSICGNVSEQVAGSWTDGGGNSIQDVCAVPIQWLTEDGGNGHWYLYNWDQTTGSEGVCWSEARARCLATGGELVAVSTPEESDFLLYAICPIAGAANGNLGWLGLMPDGNGGTAWSNGEPYVWTNWGDDQPSGDGPYAAFGCDIDGSGGGGMTWNDIGGSSGCHTSGEGGLPLSFWITEWSADCNNDGMVDYGQILDGTPLDDDGDGVPNECDPDSDGVCCLDDACVETTYGACADGGGTWFTGIDCSAVSCVPGTYSICASGCDFTDIQSAIDHAAFGGVIEVGPGTWDVDLVASGASIEFRSTDGYAATWLDGGDSHRIFRADDVAGATIKFVGFTFANGDADVDDGGALYVDGNTLVLEDCRFISNRAQYGGAVACRNGSLTMTDCIVGQAGLGNVVPEDGGGIHFSDSTLLMSGTTFDANEASQGGGLMAVRSDVTIDDCQFTANLALTYSSSENQAGGAIEFHSCPSMLMTECDFMDNEARDGGALCLQNPFNIVEPTFIIQQCLFDSNLVAGKGGAIYIGSNFGSVDACEFLNNDAGIMGNAIFIADAGEGGGAYLVYSNSLFCGSGPEPVEAYNDKVDLVDGGGNTIIDDVGDCVADGSSWIGAGSTSWFSDASNWLFGAVPGSGSDVYFNLDEVYQVDFDVDAISRSVGLSAGDVTLDLRGYLYELEDDDETDELYSFLRVQQPDSEGTLNARLTLVSSGGLGELTCTDDIDVAAVAGTSGAIELDGTVRLVANKLRIGTAGQGALRMRNGSYASAINAEVGDTQGSQGTVSLSGVDTELRLITTMNINQGMVHVDDSTITIRNEFDTGDIYIYRGGSLEGDGFIDATVYNFGSLSPGDDPGGRGMPGSGFNIIGNFIQFDGKQGPPGILHSRARASSTTMLNVAGTAYLSGGLIVDGDGTYDPSGHLFLQAGSVSGQFDVALMPVLAEEGKYMSLRYGDGLRGGQQVEIIIETLGGDVGFDPLTPPDITG